MYDDLPKCIKRSEPDGGRDQEEELQKAYQMHLRERLLAEKRDRINYYLDYAVREGGASTVLGGGKGWC